MNLLKGTIELDRKLTNEDVNKINELIERDTAKAMKVEKVGESTLEYCPTCNKLLMIGDCFCRMCGQRIDPDNKAL